MCVDRQQIIDVVFAGYADTRQPERRSARSAVDWQSPD